ncbi:MAG: NfeD family protein [Gammaproteobacteria bacterium]|nr:NfeD family protein [Gammaproteobacteria bacterium]
MEFLDQIVYWHWLVLGVLLIGAEMLDGSGHVIWLGLSALLVGIIHWAVPGLPWLAQIIIFAMASILSIYAWKAYKKANPTVNEFPTLNRRGSNYVDRVFTLSEPIVDGVGKVKVDDTIWKVEGPDLSAGTKVKVVAIDGTSFVVEAA